MDELSENAASTFLAESQVGHIAVNTASGPYVSPTSYVFSDGALWFRWLAGRRLEAIKADDRVSMSVSQAHPHTGMWRSVVIDGRATIAPDPEMGSRIVDLLRAKYREALEALVGVPIEQPDSPTVLVKVEIDSISGRTSGDYRGPRTRPARL